MKKLYLILPILSGILFGSSGIFVRTLTQNGIDATTLLFLRFSIAILILLIAVLATDKKLLKIELNDLKLFIITALCIVGLNIFYNHSMNSVPLSLAAVLLSSAPVFVIVFAYILFREKITSTKVISIVLVILGCILTTGLLEGKYGNVTAMGILGGVMAAVFWAAYTVASKKALKKEIHTYTILFYSLIIITIILLPMTNFGQITKFID